MMGGVWRGVGKNRKRRKKPKMAHTLGHTCPVLCNCRFLSILTVHIKLFLQTQLEEHLGVWGEAGGSICSNTS